MNPKVGKRRDVIRPAKYCTFQASKVLPRQITIQIPPQKTHYLYPQNTIDQHQLTMAGRRIAYVGLPVAAIGGYYFYAAGGDSKVAQKKAERLFTELQRSYENIC